MTFTIGQGAVVVDASAAVELIAGEDVARAGWARQWVDWAESGTMLLVPAHFGAEVANALLLGRRLSESDAAASLGRLWATGLEVADRGASGLLGSLELAARHGLSVYDAAYLDLALDVDGELATLDGALRQAADAEGIALATPATPATPAPRAQP